jgi:dienelactone hydrolase
VKLVTGLRTDVAKFYRRVQVALGRLNSLPQADPDRIAAIGDCLGGTFVLELARHGAPLKGVVTFHGGLEAKNPAPPGQPLPHQLADASKDEDERRRVADPLHPEQIAGHCLLRMARFIW